MDSSTESKSGLARFDRRFLRNVFVAGFLGVGLGLLVAGATFVQAVLIAIAAAVILALIFAAWGWVRERG
jgi:prepilin signal peptidase PulO-like enzyme (type II secretory pathway)